MNQVFFLCVYFRDEALMRWLLLLCLLDVSTVAYEVDFTTKKENFEVYFRTPDVRAFLITAEGAKAGVDPNLELDEYGQQFNQEGRLRSMDNIPGIVVEQQNLVYDGPPKPTTGWFISSNIFSDDLELVVSTDMPTVVGSIEVSQSTGLGKSFRFKKHRIELVLEKGKEKRVKFLFDDKKKYQSFQFSAGSFSLLEDTKLVCRMDKIKPTLLCSALIALAASYEKHVNSKPLLAAKALKGYLRLLERAKHFGKPGHGGWDDIDDDECRSLRGSKVSRGVYIDEAAYKALKMGAESLLVHPRPKK